jgi:hypothetical protein
MVGPTAAIVLRARAGSKGKLSDCPQRVEFLLLPEGDLLSLAARRDAQR